MVILLSIFSSDQLQQQERLYDGVLETLYIKEKYSEKKRKDIFRIKFQNFPGKKQTDVKISGLNSIKRKILSHIFQKKIRSVDTSRVIKPAPHVRFICIYSIPLAIRSVSLHYTARQWFKRHTEE